MGWEPGGPVRGFWPLSWLVKKTTCDVVLGGWRGCRCKTCHGGLLPILPGALLLQASREPLPGTLPTLLSHTAPTCPTLVSLAWSTTRHHVIPIISSHITFSAAPVHSVDCICRLATGRASSSPTGPHIPHLSFPHCQLTSHIL